jgi:cobalt/nickel transport system permease protein
VHIHFLDAYQGGPSPVHGLDPRVKLVATVAFILSCSLTPTGAWMGFALLFGLLMGVTRVARLSPWLVIRRSFVALPFALVAVTLVFTTPGPSLLRLDLGPWTLALSATGLILFLSLMIKSWLSVMMAVLLSATTTFPDLLRAMRDLRLPRVLVGIISFAYRYLFVLADEALRLNQARLARAAEVEGQKAGGSIGWRARVLGGMVGSLFIRSYERSERIYNAMVARGYAGQIRTLTEPPLRVSDVAIGLLFLLILGSIQVMSWLVG